MMTATRSCIMITPQSMSVMPLAVLYRNNAQTKLLVPRVGSQAHLDCAYNGVRVSRLRSK